MMSLYKPRPSKTGFYNSSYKPRRNFVFIQKSGRNRFNKAERAAVRRIIKSSKEKNYFDVVSAGGAISTTAVVTKLSGIGQGDGQGQRLGDTCELTSVEFHQIAATDAGAASGTLNNIRIMLIRWLVDDTDTAPVIGDILESTSYPYSSLVGDQADRKKFEVLVDKHLSLTVRNDSRSAYDHKDVISCKGKKIYFDAAATTGKGHIYLVTLGNNTTASGNDVTFNYYFRMRYIEP